jgi:hypothetical protein
MTHGSREYAAAARFIQQQVVGPHDGVIGAAEFRNRVAAGFLLPFIDALERNGALHGWDSVRAANTEPHSGWQSYPRGILGRVEQAHGIQC